MKSQKAFTLVELLVIMAIIGVLAFIVLAQVNSSRAKARNATRISDLRQIQIAMEAFFEASPMGQQQYPARPGSDPHSSAPFQQLVTAQLLPAVLVDPVTKRPYSYSPTTDELGRITSYCIGAKLENPTTAMLSTSDNCNSGDTTDNYTLLR